MGKKIVQLGLLLLLTGTGSVSAQEVNDFIQLFGGLAKSAINKQVAKQEWKQLSAEERDCIDRALLPQGGSVQNLIRSGTGPNDPRLSEIRSGCQKQPTPTQSQSTDSATTQAAPAAGPQSPYIVDGLALGESVHFDSATYRAYRCTLSEKFPGFTWCQRETRERQGKEIIVSSNSILHRSDGTTLYVNRYIRPAFQTEQEATTEIDRLSATFGEKPHVLRMPERKGLPGALIASWGKVELVPVEADMISALAAGKGHVPGIPIDFLGDFQKSAKLGLPVYRLSGEAGYAWNASFDRKGVGHLRFFAIDASALSAGSELTTAQPEIGNQSSSVSPAGPAQADSRCVVADPTGTPLNVRTAPNDQIISTLPNGLFVSVIDNASSVNGEQWVYVRNSDANQGYQADQPLGWVLRRYINCDSQAPESNEAAAGKAAADKAAAEKAAADKAAADKAAADKAAADKAAADQAAADKAAADKAAAADQAAADQAAADQAAADKAPAATFWANRLSQWRQKAAAEQAAADKAAAADQAAADHFPGEELTLVPPQEAEQELTPVPPQDVEQELTPVPPQEAERNRKLPSCDDPAVTAAMDKSLTAHMQAKRQANPNPPPAPFTEDDFFWTWTNAKEKQDNGNIKTCTVVMNFDVRPVEGVLPHELELVREYVQKNSLLGTYTVQFTESGELDVQPVSAEKIQGPVPPEEEKLVAGGTKCDDPDVTKAYLEKLICTNMSECRTTLEEVVEELQSREGYEKHFRERAAAQGADLSKANKDALTKLLDHAFYRDRKLIIESRLKVDYAYAEDYNEAIGRYECAAQVSFDEVAMQQGQFAATMLKYGAVGEYEAPPPGTRGTVTMETILGKVSRMRSPITLRFSVQPTQQGTLITIPPYSSPDDLFGIR